MLVDQLNEYQDTQLVYEVLDTPERDGDYIAKIEEVLNRGAIVLLGFKKPYFDLPAGMEVETSPKSSHGAVIHGFKKGQDGKTIFIVTDPEPEIAKYFGMNIEVSPERLLDSISISSRNNIEAVRVG